MPSTDTSCNDRSAWQIFCIFLRLGLTSFGGPIAHLGYFRSEFVEQRRWLNEHSYADLVALCQFLPGPASSQVGMALGLLRGGYPGAFAAWAGFTLPSAIVLILFALGLSQFAQALPAGLLHGLKVVAVAVVAQAVWGMMRNLCTDGPRRLLMLGACLLTWKLPGALGQLAIIGAAGVLGTLWLKPAAISTHEALPIGQSRRAGLLWLILFFVLLLALPLLAQWRPHDGWQLFEVFYRAGALVFGGGHVVLPLLQAEVVPHGWLNDDTFLAGYGVTQAVPGPLFTFAAFLGAAGQQSPNGWCGGLLALGAIFLPAFLLVAGALPFWESIRRHARAQRALAGINAAVVGLLLAALYHPVWTSAIHQPRDFVLALFALLALTRWKYPPWLVVTACGLLGWFWLR